MKNRIAKFLFLIVSCAFLFSCSNKKMEKFEESKFLFGTYIKIIIYDTDMNKAKEAATKAFDEIERIDNEYNSKTEGSLIYKLNNSSDKKIALDKEGQEIFQEVQKTYELSNHKYDVTIGPLLELWGFTDESIDSSNLKLPTQAQIDYTKQFIDFGKVKFEDRNIELTGKIKEIDTGSFLKGYAISKAKEVLEKEGIKSAFITSISSLAMIGSKPEGKPWKIGLQNPENLNDILGIVELKNKAMGVSGDYQTYVEINGKLYHHILDKETGYPVSDKKMVVVVCDNAFQADLLSTAFFLMPIDKIFEYVDKHKDVEVLIVDKNMDIIKTKNFKYEEIKK